MQGNEVTTSRMRRTVNDLVLAEMFLVQATIESASAIGEGVNELGKRISSSDESNESSWDSISSVLQRTAGEALEPYTTRFKYLRGLMDDESR
jgi:hypothetical protein